MNGRGLSLLFLMVVLPTARLFAFAVPAVLPSAYADTEASTNVALTALGRDDRRFSLVLELDAAASNAVEVAFGTDRDGDGRLAIEESEFALGWVAGSWFLEDYRADVSDRTEAAEGTRRLMWTVRLNDRGNARQAVAKDGGLPVLTVATATCRPTYYSADWNLARVTRRGVLDTSEHVELRISSVGLEVHVR